MPSDANVEKRTDHKSDPIWIHRRLWALRAYLKYVDPKLSRTSDRLLASIGYPARALAWWLRAFPSLSGNLAALSDSVSDYRTGYRVLTTPQTIEWALDLLLANPNKSRWRRASDYVQAVSGVAYQTLEDFAWLASKGILPISPKRQADLWVVSCWFWAIHVALELLKLAIMRIQGKPVDYRALLVNLAWAPLTVHWSTYNGILSPSWVGVLGSAACWPQLLQQWKA